MGRGKGVWSFDAETGEFVLEDEYQEKLDAVKLDATIAFNESMYARLAEMTAYTVDELRDEWHRRVMETDIPPMGRCNEFIVEALTGEL